MQIAAEKEKVAKEDADAKAKEAEETWAKLGDKISSFWGGDGEEKKEGGEAADKTADGQDEKKSDEEAYAEIRFICMKYTYTYYVFVKRKLKLSLILDSRRYADLKLNLKPFIKI